ncbi:MAG: ATP synthase F1 subunit delta [Bacteroidia bacterium]|nr:ATP synthase F1 subunit delta [Bacteroidia bacterium]NND25685.1 ATP synthase F1 subunit delta [Flavobacteriaceae bacterium]MBT8279249.1 ATP synthase F1 subunit delta [Bacteroidia bacterium]NNK59785.1 ATP synthase F1 subunit delta [Flavobacteriaceae bacterium]NNL32049.1 ATP synthase F1 subunit delta [Flavobacteriaceae bacterium]
MARSRAAIRYAKAILSLAKDQNSSEAVNADMKLISQTVSESRELSRILKSDVVKTDLKKSALVNIFSGINKLSTQVFDLLISNNRLSILADVAATYNELFDDLNGKEKASVTTAVPMTSELEIKVLAKVKELTNKAVELENIVDESILGGFILRIGDKQYNASIANQLNTLKREFTLN